MLIVIYNATGMHILENISPPGVCIHLIIHENILEQPVLLYHLLMHVHRARVMTLGARNAVVLVLPGLRRTYRISRTPMLIMSGSPGLGITSRITPAANLLSSMWQAHVVDSLGWDVTNDRLAQYYCRACGLVPGIRVRTCGTPGSSPSAQQLLEPCQFPRHTI